MLGTADTLLVPTYGAVIAHELGLKHREIDLSNPPGRLYPQAYLHNPSQTILMAAGPTGEKSLNFMFAHEAAHWLLGSSETWSRKVQSAADVLAFLEFWNNVEIPADRLALSLLAPGFIFRYLASVLPCVPLAEYFGILPVHLFRRVALEESRGCVLKAYIRDPDLRLGCVVARVPDFDMADMMSRILASTDEGKDVLGYLSTDQDGHTNKNAFNLEFVDKHGLVWPLSYPREWPTSFREADEKRGLMTVISKAFDDNEHKTKRWHVSVRSGHLWNDLSLVQVIPVSAWDAHPTQDVVYVWEIPLSSYLFVDHVMATGALYPPWFPQTGGSPVFKTEDHVRSWLNEIRRTMRLPERDYTKDLIVHDTFDKLPSLKSLGDYAAKYADYVRRAFTTMSLPVSGVYGEGSVMFWKDEE